MTAPLANLATALNANVIPTDDGGRIVQVEADIIEAVAFNYGLSIEIAGDRAYLTLDGITFTAPLSAAAS